MLQRMVIGFLVLSVLTLLLAQPILAGGWAVVTLDTLPVNVQAGERVQVSFLVQQHGVHPLVLGAGEVILLAHRQGGHEAIRAVAEPAGEPGHYAVVIVFPTGGVWSWEVRPGGFPPAAMPDLAVAPGVEQPAAKRLPLPEQWGWWQQVVFQWISSLRRPAEPAPAAANVDLATDQIAYGKALFVAKGCVTCHGHDLLFTQFSVELGPNLTHYNVIPEYVRVWLRDPQSIKPGTQMPRLRLNDQEIEALVAFLGAEQE